MKTFTEAGGVKEKRAAALRTERRNRKEAKKKSKDADEPNRPPRAFLMWVAENREQIQDHTMKKASEMWKTLVESGKAPFKQKYQKKQAEYKAAVEEYK